MVVAADDVRHAHIVIVDDDREHIRRRAFRPQQDHVVQLGVGHGNLALYLIDDGHTAGLRRAEADDERCAAAVGRIAVAPAPVIAHRRLRGALGGAHRLKLVGRGEAFIGVACCQQGVGDPGMAGGTLELHHRRAVPVEAEPAHPVEDRVDGGLRRSRPVGILDAQQEPSAVTPRIQQVEQRRPRPADMQETGRGGRKAGDDGGDGPGFGGRCAHAAFIQ